jgi:type II secretory pathway predicted ATPase ExeA
MEKTQMALSAKELLQRLIDDNPEASEEEICLRLAQEIERDEALKKAILKQVYEALLRKLETDWETANQS